VRDISNRKAKENRDTFSGYGYNCQSLIDGTDKADVDIEDE